MLEFNVAGTNFKSENVKKAAEVFKTTPLLMKVKLVKEPTNVYDPNAVQVLINVGDNFEFIHCGYVPKHFSEEFTEYFGHVKNPIVNFIGKVDGLRGTTIIISFELDDDYVEKESVTTADDILNF